MTKLRLPFWIGSGLMIGLSATLAIALFIQATPALRPVVAPEYTGTALDSLAADFRLLSHKNQEMALADFRGQIVVLTFMDSQCQETCPLTAAQLRQAYTTLGNESASVVFLGVNVNVKANRVADVQAATKEWRLDEIPTWHFLTGNSEELEAVWQAYGVGVMPATQAEELAHGSGVYLIDRTGRLRWYISVPFDASGRTVAGMRPLSELLVIHLRELLREK
jgi:protein SCO1/2